MRPESQWETIPHQRTNHGEGPAVHGGGAGKLNTRKAVLSRAEVAGTSACLPYFGRQAEEYIGRHRGENLNDRQVMRYTLYDYITRSWTLGIVHDQLRSRGA